MAKKNAISQPSKLVKMKAVLKKNDLPQSILYPRKHRIILAIPCPLESGCIRN